MGLFRYIVQGFGWEIGREAAREGIDALERQTRDRETPASRRELAKLAKARAKQEARERAEREAAAKRKRADIERQLETLKKNARS